MKTSEIIKKAAQQEGFDPEMALKAASIKIRQQGLMPVQFKDSVMLFKPLAEGVGYVYFVTADSPLNAISSFKHFKHNLDKSGVHTVYMEQQNPMILKTLERSGIHPEPSNLGRYALMAHV